MFCVTLGLVTGKILVGGKAFAPPSLVYRGCKFETSDILRMPLRLPILRLVRATRFSAFLGCSGVHVLVSSCLPPLSK